MSFELQVQGTMFQALTGHAPLMALVTAVYDNVPQATSVFPYVVVGEATHNDWSTDTSSGDDATVTIHTWSRYSGRAETKQIQGAVYDALHRANLTVQGYALVAIDWLQSETFIDQDGKTRHGVQTFRLIIDET